MIHNYKENVGVGDVRLKMAKLWANVWGGQIPEKSGEMIFYASPDLTPDAKDLVLYQASHAVSPRPAHASVGRTSALTAIPPICCGI